MSDITVKQKVEVKTDIEEPTQYNVIYVNDNGTTMEFVMVSLIEFFGYNEEDAYEKTMEVHEKGAAVVATCSYEVAHESANEIMRIARASGFPLLVEVEEE